jgi:RNA polymerase sigma-70 factor, ECF subfamily
MFCEAGVRWRDQSHFIDQPPERCTMLSSPAAHASITANPAAAVSAVAVPWSDLMTHRDYLVRFAQRKLHDPSLAEDAVHDVFEAVLSGRATFAGRSALRSWLTAVLKNKIVDVIRQRARFDSLEMEGDSDEGGDAVEPRYSVGEQAGPQELTEQRERLHLALQGIEQLAPGLRDVMKFRVLQDESSGTVCRRLGISEASLFVRLHRARKQLMGCEVNAALAGAKRGYAAGVSKASFGAYL